MTHNMQGKQTSEQAAIEAVKQDMNFLLQSNKKSILMTMFNTSENTSGGLGNAHPSTSKGTQRTPSQTQTTATTTSKSKSVVDLRNNLIESRPPVKTATQQQMSHKSTTKPSKPSMDNRDSVAVKKAESPTVRKRLKKKSYLSNGEPVTEEIDLDDHFDQDEDIVVRKREETSNKLEKFKHKPSQSNGTKSTSDPRVAIDSDDENINIDNANNELDEMEAYLFEAADNIERQLKNSESAEANVDIVMEDNFEVDLDGVDFGEIEVDLDINLEGIDLGEMDLSDINVDLEGELEVQQQQQQQQQQEPQHELEPQPESEPEREPELEPKQQQQSKQQSKNVVNKSSGEKQKPKTSSTTTGPTDAKHKSKKTKESTQTSTQQQSSQTTVETVEDPLIVAERLIEVAVKKARRQDNLDTMFKSFFYTCVMTSFNETYIDDAMKNIVNTKSLPQSERQIIINDVARCKAVEEDIYTVASGFGDFINIMVDGKDGFQWSRLSEMLLEMKGAVGVKTERLGKVHVECYVSKDVPTKSGQMYSLRVRKENPETKVVTCEIYNLMTKWFEITLAWLVVMTIHTSLSEDVKKCIVAKDGENINSKMSDYVRGTRGVGKRNNLLKSLKDSFKYIVKLVGNTDIATKIKEKVSPEWFEDDTK